MSIRINADLQLNDVPGQLLRALTPIAEVGGNIVGIVHERSNVINGKIVVKVVFDIESEDLPIVLEKLRKSEVEVMRIGELKNRKRTTLLVKDVSNLEGISSMSAEGDYAIITIEAEDEEELERRVEGYEFIARSIE
ncbi:MAG: ACT domain-containing protein [Candidatus Thermoplasmatota archaeon]|nr:ACT domain-containing protein [Candidatus Thermoplasmatota archaeon]